MGLPSSWIQSQEIVENLEQITSQEMSVQPITGHKTFPQILYKLMTWTKIKKKLKKKITTKMSFREKVKDKVSGFCNERNCLDEILGDPASRVSPSCRSGQKSSSTTLIMPTEKFPVSDWISWTGHTNPRHQCHQTQCHQDMNAPVHLLHHIGRNGWSLWILFRGWWKLLFSPKPAVCWRNYVGCACSSLRLSSSLSKWGFS